MSEPHSTLAKFIHWTFIPLYAYGIFKQLDDLSQLEDTGLLIFEVIFASVFLLIVIMRFSYMKRYETFAGAREPIHYVHVFAAKAVHLSMYLCLILLPLTGLVIAGLFVQGTKTGVLQDGALAIHELSALMSYYLIGIHVLAAIYARIKGDGVWSSMVPWLKETGPNENKYVQKISELEHQLYEKISDFMPAKRQNNHICGSA